MDGIEGDESSLLRAECAELGVEPPADEAVDMMLRLRVGDDAERAVDAHDEEEPTDPWLAGTRRMAISSNHHE